MPSGLLSVAPIRLCMLAIFRVTFAYCSPHPSRRCPKTQSCRSAVVASSLPVLRERDGVLQRRCHDKLTATSVRRVRELTFIESPITDMTAGRRVCYSKGIHKGVNDIFGDRGVRSRCRFAQWRLSLESTLNERPVPRNESRARGDATIPKSPTPRRSTAETLQPGVSECCPARIPIPAA